MPALGPRFWVCWVGHFLLEASAEPVVVHGKLGGEVSLVPDAKPLKSIVWKEGEDLAMQWDRNEMDSYRQFSDRGHLNTSNGVMTIKGLTLSDSGLYTPEIDNVIGLTQRLTVISGVPVPSVSASCDAEITKCDLTCVGDVAGAQPVSTVWKLDGKEILETSDATWTILKEESTESKEISCALKNPVSREESNSIHPFTANARELNISTGVIVLIFLLLALALLVVFHRLKAGAWFFDKGSMPWEADFWQKNPAPREVAEANGNMAHQPTPDEETPMTN